MAKCKALTGSAVKGLITAIRTYCYHSNTEHTLSPRRPQDCPNVAVNCLNVIFIGVCLKCCIFISLGSLILVVHLTVDTGCLTDQQV